MRQAIGDFLLRRLHGIAGAYSEHVPVILISGSLPLRAVQRLE